MTAIVHLSLPAAEPRRVAKVLAKLMRGRVSNFSPTKGAFYVGTDSPTAAAIEVYPEHTALVPGEGPEAPGRFVETESAPRHGPVHVALASPLTRAEVMALGTGEGWRTLPCRRGDSFNVIELWLENRLLIEVVAAEDQEEALPALRIS
ncbi:MAG: hypothetical protein ACREER_11155 [Alphaproteobacteria bacterium]